MWEEEREGQGDEGIKVEGEQGADLLPDQAQGQCCQGRGARCRTNKK